MLVRNREEAGVTGGKGGGSKGERKCRFMHNQKSLDHRTAYHSVPFVAEFLCATDGIYVQVYI